MKRSVAVCLMASVLLAMSTAAFATPVTVTVSSGDIVWNNTVNSGITNNTAFPGGTGLITWFQPFSFSAPAPDLSPYPAGGTLTLDKQITSAMLTIVASGVQAGQIDNAAIQNNASVFETLGALKQLSPNVLSGSTTTVFGWPTGTDYSLPLTGATGIDWLPQTTGFNAKVTLTQYPTNQGDAVTSSQLNATTHFTFTYTYDDGQQPPPPVVPAPGAILLASMGAGLVSWLRARKSL